MEDLRADMISGEMDRQMSSQTAARFRQYIRNHHRSASMRFLANIAQKFLRAYFNEGLYEFDVNGERFLE